MKSSRFLLPVSALLLAAANIACEDDVSPIGGSIATGEVAISIDSLEYELPTRSIENPIFDARSGNILLGNINVPEYGSLSCSFVTRLLSISQMPDSIVKSQDALNNYLEHLDSCALQLVMIRGNFVGDSLAPQQLKVYKLDKQLPNNITNDFNPAGYYTPSAPLGRKNYTIVNSGASDNSYLSYGSYLMNVPIEKQFAVDIFKKYMEDPSIFNWPDKFAQFIPGLYLESSFGNGCLANFSQLAITAYSYHLAEVMDKDDAGNIIKDDEGNIVYTTVHSKDSLVLCNTAPEVLSSNRIDYKPSQSLINKIKAGQAIVTSPGGYTAEITFPANDIIEKYKKGNSNISIVSGLSMTIPADTVPNGYGLTGAPYILMVKSTEVKDFFDKNQLPDNKTSFYAQYDATVGGYRFPDLRSYILDLIEKGTATPEDTEFSLIPVLISFESGVNSSTASYVVKCVPYTLRPTMMLLDTKKTSIVFTYSSQKVD